MDRLDPLARDVLDELCQTTVTGNAVVLTETLVNRGRLSAFGDCYGLIAAILADLNRLGLVAYSVGYGDVPIRIRVTQPGALRVGYAHRAREVGRGISTGQRRRRDDASRSGDTSDFRNYRETADGGDIERMPLTLHVAKYPDHRDKHQAQLEERDMAAQQKYDDATALRALAMIEAGRTNTQVATELHIPVGSISGALIPRARRLRAETETPPPADESLRSAVIAVLGDHPGIESESLLTRLRSRYGERRSVGRHEVQHLVGSLIRQGVVEGRQVQNGNTKTYGPLRLRPTERIDAERARRDVEQRIDAARRDFEQRTTTVVPGAATAATTRLDQPEITAEPEVESEPVPEPIAGYEQPSARWPILDALRETAGRRNEANRTASALLEAAAALEGVDDEMSETLSARAAAVVSQYTLSRLEDEYLRYAEACEDEYLLLGEDDEESGPIEAPSLPAFDIESA
jgi:hypothetical protein